VRDIIEGDRQASAKGITMTDLQNVKASPGIKPDVVCGQRVFFKNMKVISPLKYSKGDL
jgi:hypothetical protein